ncbi:MAG: threonine ammonia-lyase [Ekhidna sp.]|nr:threonine ammonia-lyase [Ekhidna sp.]
MTTLENTISLSNIEQAATSIKEVASLTPLLYNLNHSEKFGAKILFKREDLQPVRSYKIRGAYNKMSSLTPDDSKAGVVCASAGNHAQGVAYSCHKLKIKGTIFMPIPTPNQKVEQVRMFGKEYVDIQLVGDTFDDSYQAALQFQKENHASFIHPFDDQKVIEGQGTVGLEILNQIEDPIDYLILPIGGGGLAAGVSTVFKTLSPKTKIIGIEPLGAPAMQTSISNGKNTTLGKIEKFVDGAAVRQVGDLTFEICKNTLDDVLTVHEGKICETMLELYNREAVIVEPAGALSISALDQIRDDIEGKTVVCVVSGSNNDITRTEEIKERALLYKGLKHYFVVRFPQRAGALKEFVAEILGPKDDITHFEYTKKNSREKGAAVVGVELSSPEDLPSLIERMKEKHFFGSYLNNQPELLNLIV